MRTRVCRVAVGEPFIGVSTFGMPLDEERRTSRIEKTVNEVLCKTKTRRDDMETYSASGVV